ncbi:hypothetical protein DM01DRAFT_1338262 [Hesseltinella vesiculosa]|uniref:F-box domain-containing protein n=1 Tax=Hesseltinella vesiculosa TaxID=101127 RepID=A0A1X2GAC5_9FUNG|nr:hypothetical protein DM01DRAFT_1338262 [Hesseltinella vesiculosa]
MEHLPIELVCSIDQYLDRSDRYQCSQVCRQWCQVFRPLLYQDIHMVSSKQYEQFHKLLNRTVPRIRHLSFKNLLLPHTLSVIHHPSTQLESLSIVNSMDSVFGAYAIPLQPNDDLASRMPVTSLFANTGSSLHHHQRPALSSPSAMTRRPGPTILTAMALHRHSLRKLTLSYSITLLDIRLLNLVKSLPPCLTELALHQITAPMTMSHLDLLYDTCPHLNKLSLQGHHFSMSLASLDSTDPPPGVWLSGAASSSSGAAASATAPKKSDRRRPDGPVAVRDKLLSLDLDFGLLDGLDALFQYMATYRPNRHDHLQHLGLAVGISTASGLEHCHFDPLYSDDRRPTYEALANVCGQHLTSLRMKNLLLTGLLSTPRPPRLRDITIDMCFDISPPVMVQWVASVVNTIEHLTLVSSGQVYDPAIVYSQLLRCHRLKHLDLSLAYELDHWLALPELLLAREAHGQEDPDAASDLLTPMDDGSPTWATDAPVNDGLDDPKKHEPQPTWTWLLDSLPSLTSITLRYSSSLLYHGQLWLTRHLRSLRLHMVLLDRSWMSVIASLPHVKELEFQHCVCIHSSISLDLPDHHLDRIHIQSQVMGRYTRFNQGADDALSHILLHQPPAASRSFALDLTVDVPKTFEITCRSLRLLQAGSKRWFCH